MELTTSQSEFVEAALAGKTSTLLLGKAGVGKSVAIRAVIERADEEGKSFFVAAPTGVAALAIGGNTIHYLVNILKRVKISHLDFILIDEASMIRADLFDAFDQAMRTAMSKNLPFGGVRVALVGDPMQLPPVMKKGDADSDRVAKLYPAPYFFSSYAFGEMDWKIIELEKIFRQTDTQYTDMLNAIRSGEVADWLNFLNDNRRIPNGEKCKGVVLTPKNDAADQINRKKLSQIDSKEFRYVCSYGGKFYPREFPADETLFLKVGAKVMVIKNLYDSDGCLRLANGDTGVVAELEDKSVMFASDRTGETLKISANKWAKTEKVEDDEGNLVDEEVGFFSQIPLRLSWAVTIHKAQGATLDELTIDLRSRLFAKGQAYVALSRGRSLEKLWLYGKLVRSDVMVCPKIVDFLANKLNSRYVQKKGASTEAEWELGV